MRKTAVSSTGWQMFTKFSKEYMKLWIKNININSWIQHSNNLSLFKALYYIILHHHSSWRKKKSHIIFHEQPRVLENIWDFMVLLWRLTLAIILRFQKGEFSIFAFALICRFEGWLILLCNWFYFAIIWFTEVTVLRGRGHVLFLNKLYVMLEGFFSWVSARHL